MPKILILYAHPHHHLSRINQALVSEAQKLPHVVVHDLYQAYPNLYIDVPHEQKLLLEADLIVMQFPLFWYSAPALLHLWEERVLDHGFGYGREDTPIRGKDLMLCISTGATEPAYAPGAHANFKIETLLTPFEQMASLCKLNYQQPFITFGSARVTDEKLDETCLAYRDRLMTYTHEKAGGTA